MFSELQQKINKTFTIDVNRIMRRRKGMQIRNYAANPARSHGATGGSNRPRANAQTSAGSNQSASKFVLFLLSLC